MPGQAPRRRARHTSGQVFLQEGKARVWTRHTSGQAPCKRARLSGSANCPVMSLLEGFGEVPLVIVFAPLPNT
eukprot:scaffold128821_cov20-Tisochrysis_lutea.AAC.1